MPASATKTESVATHSSALPGLALAMAGGGTGGHIVPGLQLVEWAVAHADRLDEPLRDVVWFLSGRQVEQRVLGANVPRDVALERIPLALEPSDGGAPSRVGLAWRTAPAVVRARRALRAHGAQVLLGLGGFTSLPAVLAARSLRLPVALLEVNARPGAATRWLARLSDVVLHVWPASESIHAATGTPQRCIGAPLAPRFLQGAPSAADRSAARAELGLDPGYPVLVVLGGSQGASSLNRFVQQHHAAFVAAGVQVLHQTGPGREGEGARAVPGYRPLEYVERVDRALSAATLVLCRGGASTLAEVAAMRRPAFVVPYPHHKDRHQEHNALALGAGVRLVGDDTLADDAPDDAPSDAPSDAPGATLRDELVRMCMPNADPERRAMSDALARVVPIDDEHCGAARLYNELSELSSRSSP